MYHVLAGDAYSTVHIVRNNHTGVDKGTGFGMSSHCIWPNLESEFGHVVRTSLAIKFVWMTCTQYAHSERSLKTLYFNDYLHQSRKEDSKGQKSVQRTL